MLDTCFWCLISFGGMSYLKIGSNNKLHISYWFDRSYFSLRNKYYSLNLYIQQGRTFKCLKWETHLNWHCYVMPFFTWTNMRYIIYWSFYQNQDDMKNNINDNSVIRCRSLTIGIKSRSNSNSTFSLKLDFSFCLIGWERDVHGATFAALSQSSKSWKSNLKLITLTGVAELSPHWYCCSKETTLLSLVSHSFFAAKTSVRTKLR
jgi:hypothetical protein